MTDASTRPGDEPEAGASTPHPPAAQSEPTGVIDVGSTQAIPQAAPAPGAGASHGDTPHDDAGGDPGRDDSAGWFDRFAPEHPTEGAGVPARADAPWGSDRADAEDEAAHRAAYAPPTAAATASAPGQGSPMSAVAAPTAGGPTQGYRAGLGAASGPATAQGAPGGWGTDPSAYGPPVTAAPPGRRRGTLVAGVVGLCLLSGVVGGVAGQLADDRVNLAGSTLPEPGPGATARPAGSVANIAATALPSVVTIKVDGGSEGSGTGSGFVVDAKGHVLTNNHVVEAGASGGDIEVVLSNGDTEKATIVGRDVSYDLAVLKLARTDLTPLVLGESDQIVVGDQVIAVGAPLGLEQTVTTGIVSALNRPVTPGTGSESSYINAIQTDAAINPGNSGGPLLDLSGKVIGVNSAIARVPGTSGTTGGNIGLGFAIPSDQARRTADQLIATGKATHPVIGVSLDRTFSGEGAQVVDQSDAVVAGGPAAKAGVQPGDVITGFEGKRVRTPDQLIVSIRARAVGDTVSLTVRRGGQDVKLRMTLEADPDQK
ncbi:putative serine protease PepD [Terracoccus luteus]|uniref:Putative serine protease PepD n=1 Tax=Terracoccus luteus TaxID=53356 RepID=A0A495XZN9_9MICO|nr:trypsin-like peptidase domain-containing protein [Terracoccus luteus]RKT78625.1 putative serine protease PepD [Terracoccus luteus]